MVQKRNTGHGDTITPWRVSSNQEGNYKTNVPINATLIGAGSTTVSTVFIIFMSLFRESDNIVKTIHIGCLVTSVLQIPLALAFIIKHNKKTSKINPVVPRTLQFHEDEREINPVVPRTLQFLGDEHDCDAISNNENDETTENDGHQIVTCAEVYDYVESMDNAHENIGKSDENSEYLEFSVSKVKLTEIGEATGQLPGEVCHI